MAQLSRLEEDPPPPTLFMHASYGVPDQYPNGIADVVGYWAENRVLGGVVLLDRSEAWDDEHSPEPNVYLHSDRKDVTFRVWQMLDEQQQALLDFLVSSPPGSTAASGRAQVCPLPLSATDENMKRLYPKDATGNKVYRDIWERAPDGGFRHCVQKPLDYPEYYTSR
jgi:hypothetical protein